MLTLEAMRKRSRHVYYGWWMAWAGALINCVGAFYTQGFSVFFIPFREALGLSSAQTAFVLSAAKLQGGLEGPLAGWLIDRFGSHRMQTVGAAITGVGFILLGLFVHDYLTLILAYLAVISVGFNMGFSQANLAAMNTWFIRHRTLVMSMQTMGSRVGGFLLVPLISVVVLTWGWRTGAIVIGIIILAVAVPLSAVFRRSPESMGLRPDGDPPSDTADSKPANRPAHGHGGRVISGSQGDFEVKEAFHSPSYWILAFAVAMRSTVHTAVIVHLVPMMVTKGMSQQGGANMLGLLALFGAPLALSLGWLGDRVDKRRLLAFSMLMGTLGVLLLQFSQSTWQLYIVVGLVTFSESVGTLAWSLLGEFFGRTRFATLRGTMTFIQGAANFIGPVYAGIVVDRTGNYDEALTVFAIASAICAMVYFLMRPPALPLRLRQDSHVEQPAGS